MKSNMAHCPYRLGIGDRKCNQGCWDYPRCVDLGPPSKAERAIGWLRRVARTIAERRAA